ncbi:MAG: aa3-type cytochrome c oxidase subunit IV [Rhodobiaceae bacterium]|nr:aa3-type cytochrome c oxidase subunit IV [Rhodobiaceae bacterium]MCC0013148.1 aa3-type cytochrome c oxidase subunit IV [Rhodobiaceae bacterium]
MASKNGETVMDYPAHERTYEGFIDFSKVGSISCLNILVALSFVNMEHGILAILFTLAMLITTAIGLAFRPKGYVVGLVQLILGLVAMALLA